MQVGDLVRHHNYPRSIGIIIETHGTPTGDRVNPPTIRVHWTIPPSPHFVDLLGSVYLRRIKCS